MDNNYGDDKEKERRLDLLNYQLKEIENANPGRKAWITDTSHEKVVIDIPVEIAKSYLVEGDL